MTFDIDANGILSVSAKDEGTGKEQKITVTGSSNLSKDDVERMVKEAAAHAEEDKKQREKVEKKNSADNLIYNVEKSLNDLGEKVEESEKNEIQTKIETLRNIMNSDDSEEFENAFQDLQSSAFALSQKIYDQQNQNTTDTDDVVDAEVVEEA